MFEETTGTLLSGDLFTQAGDGPALTRESLVEAAARTEDMPCTPMWTISRTTDQERSAALRLLLIERTILAVNVRVWLADLHQG